MSVKRNVHQYTNDESETSENEKIILSEIMDLESKIME